MSERGKCVGRLSWLSRQGVCAAALALSALPAHAQNSMATPAEIDKALRVLDRWIGRWNVTTTTTRPAASIVTSVTTNSWILGERFVQGDSGTKSDGSRDLSVMTFDALTRVYPLWIFSSTGVVYYLAEGRWDEANRTMLWDSPANLSGSYRYRCRFPDDDTYRCHSFIKDWKGSVVFELENVGTRAQ